MMIIKTVNSIPGFSRYEVHISPFRIVSRSTGEALRPFTRGDGRGHLRVQVVGDDGKRVARSIITIAALAWHGQCPAGYVAYWAGGEITPASVQYIKQEKALAIRRRRVSEWERFRIVELYFEEGLTQGQIAEKYGISQPAVSRMIRG